MARPPSAKSIIRNIKKQEKYEPKTPIASDMFLPNNSGDHIKSIKTNSPINDEDLANKKYVDDTASSLWEVDGTETQLKTADEIDMQTKKIINVVDPTENQEVATKKYVDDQNVPIPFYDTGWINRSDWSDVHLGSNTTKNTDSNVTHSLNTGLRNLLVRVFISTDGTDANGFEAAQQALTYGYTVYQVDNDNVIVQTHDNGLVYIDANGGNQNITTNDWYYSIKIWELG